MESVIGDYDKFTQTLLQSALNIGMFISRYELDHICYRTERADEYIKMRAKLMPFCAEVATTRHNRREFSIFKLTQPLFVGDLTIPLVELPAPALGKSYASGLEHIEVVIRHGFEDFCDQHKALFTHQPDMDTVNPTASITFPNKATIKFHPVALDEAVTLQGNKFEVIAL